MVWHTLICPNQPGLIFAREGMTPSRVVKPRDVSGQAETDGHAAYKDGHAQCVLGQRVHSALRGTISETLKWLMIIYKWSYMYDILLAIVTLDKVFWRYQTEEYIWRRPKNHFLSKETSFWKFWNWIQNVPSPLVLRHCACVAMRAFWQGAGGKKKLGFQHLSLDATDVLPELAHRSLILEKDTRMSWHLFGNR